MERHTVIRARQTGVTLVELLVVLVILALASTAVLLNTPPARPGVQEEAERMAARIRIALDESMTTRKSFRLVLDEGGYDFEVFTQGQWTQMPDHRFLARRDFSKGVTAEISTAEAAMANARSLGESARPVIDEKTRLTLDPLGAQDQLQVRLSSRDGAFLVKLDATGVAEASRD
ncbi:MAG: prepilin-type N-terminal cleavage/methylation domain-containing protein [Parvularculaceae bacterium]